LVFSELNETWPNHALQRTAPCVTAPASAAAFPPTMQVPRRTLVSDALPFGRLCYGGPNAASNAISYAKHFSRSQHATIRVYDQAGTVIETHEHAGDFKVW
jgi:hypothetical protein